MLQRVTAVTLIVTVINTKLTTGAGALASLSQARQALSQQRGTKWYSPGSSGDCCTASAAATARGAV
jgi:hypothetical protein